MLQHSIKQVHKLNITGRGAFNKTLSMSKIIKVVVHRSLGTKALDSKLLNQSIEEMRWITGQQPVVTRAKKSIATFKIREGMSLGIKVTLRGDKMYAFLDRLIHLVLPQVKDFKGLNSNQFDAKGNYNLGLSDQSVFPELKLDFNDARLGLDISIVTNLPNRSQAEAFLTSLGFPFVKK